VSGSLALLELSIRVRLTDEFRSGTLPAIDCRDFIQPLDFGREIDIEPLRRVVAACMSEPGDSPEGSDPWLAPRLHAALRLSRREAAERRIWSYLTVAALPDYVRWRFRGDRAPVPVDRFLGRDSRNALARLWWAAELTRNGPDYTSVSQALSVPGFHKRWLELDALHRRSAALAVVRFLTEFDNGGGASDEQSRALAKALNLRLAAVSLDGLCPAEPADMDAVAAWCREPVDVDSLLKRELPPGPDEPPVAERELEPVLALLQELSEAIALGFVRRHRSEPAEPDVDVFADDI
jgi:hypothetical protein